MTTVALESSISANSEKIIELYQKVKSGQLVVDPSFQRKLVWRKPHKINFINTILLNYPFPEVYKAPGNLDVDTLELSDWVVDGQQRITTIRDFIEGAGVFALKGTQPKFNELTDEQKRSFLNYDVSVRYLKNVSHEQIKEIFQRINNTEYSLNGTERTNAQWGDSEFVYFCKQIVEKSLRIDDGFLEFNLDAASRDKFLNFFHGSKIFTENDNSRMLSLQFILTLVATLIKGEYFRRNDNTQKYIEEFNELFEDADEISSRLIKVIEFIESCEFGQKSYWLNKANIFSIICELYKYDVEAINIEKFKDLLLNLEQKYSEYMKDESSEIESKYQKYFEFSREGVNEKTARDHRGSIINEVIQLSL